MKRLLALGSVLSLLLCVSVAQGADYKKMTIRAATANPQGSLHVTAIEKFKEVVESESNGAITVQTFYGGALGDEQANVKQCRDGELDLTVVACGNATPLAPSAGAVYLPYEFASLDDAKKLFTNKEFTDTLAAAIVKESRTRPLGWLIGGYRHITNSKHPITKMEDMKGLKIRVPAVELQLAAFRSWGVEPHPLAWSETFNGLQQGVIDGQENPHTVNRDQKFWEVQKYVTENHYLLWVGPILVSERWYSKLDPDTKALVDKAAAEAVQTEWAWSDEQDAIARQDCIDHGMVIDQLTDEPAWMEAARGVWPNFYDKVGGKELIDKALAIMAK
ncbi:MAG: TRAP transporter substrate-binding protein [Desulfovibrionaceae bacterium]|nr:TRAP transporter substrate-binding protein [Desulfovibrionaceae bacterium]